MCREVNAGHSFCKFLLLCFTHNLFSHIYIAFKMLTTPTHPPPPFLLPKNRWWFRRGTNVLLFASRSTCKTRELENSRKVLYFLVRASGKSPDTRAERAIPQGKESDCKVRLFCRKKSYVTTLTSVTYTKWGLFPTHSRFSTLLFTP